MSDICNEIMLHSPSKLDMCPHGKERQECPKCRQPSIAETLFKRQLLENTKKLEDALAACEKK